MSQSDLYPINDLLLYPETSSRGENVAYRDRVERSREVIRHCYRNFLGAFRTNSYDWFTAQLTEQFSMKPWRCLRTGLCRTEKMFWDRAMAFSWMLDVGCLGVDGSEVFGEVTDFASGGNIYSTKMMRRCLLERRIKSLRYWSDAYEVE